MSSDILGSILPKINIDKIELRESKASDGKAQRQYRVFISILENDDAKLLTWSELPGDIKENIKFFRLHGDTEDELKVLTQPATIKDLLTNAVYYSKLQSISNFDLTADIVEIGGKRYKKYSRSDVYEQPFTSTNAFFGFVCTYKIGNEIFLGDISVVKILQNEVIKPEILINNDPVTYAPYEYFYDYTYKQKISKFFFDSSIISKISNLPTIVAKKTYRNSYFGDMIISLKGQSILEFKTSFNKTKFIQEYTTFNINNEEIDNTINYQFQIFKKNKNSAYDFKNLSPITNNDPENLIFEYNLERLKGDYFIKAKIIFQDGTINFVNQKFKDLIELKNQVLTYSKNIDLYAKTKNEAIKANIQNYYDKNFSNNNFITPFSSILQTITQAKQHEIGQISQSILNSLKPQNVQPSIAYEILEILDSIINIYRKLLNKKNNESTGQANNQIVYEHVFKTYNGKTKISSTDWERILIPNTLNLFYKGIEYNFDNPNDIQKNIKDYKRLFYPNEKNLSDIDLLIKEKAKSLEDLLESFYKKILEKEIDIQIPKTSRRNNINVQIENAVQDALKATIGDRKASEIANTLNNNVFLNNKINEINEKVNLNSDRIFSNINLVETDQSTNALTALSTIQTSNNILQNNKINISSPVQFVTFKPPK